MKNGSGVAKKKKIGSKSYAFEITNNPDAFKKEEKWKNVRIFEKKGNDYHYYVTPVAWEENGKAMRAISNGEGVRFFTRRENGLYISIDSSDHVLMGGFVLKMSKSLLLKSAIFYQSVWIGMDGYTPNIMYGVLTGNVALIKNDDIFGMITLPRKEPAMGYPLFLLDRENNNIELVFIPYIPQENLDGERDLVENVKRIEAFKKFNEKTGIMVLNGKGKDMVPDGFFPKQVLFLSEERILIRGEGEKFFELSRIDGEWMPATGEIIGEEFTGNMKAYAVKRAYRLSGGEMLLQYGEPNSRINVIGILNFKERNIDILKPSFKSFTFLFSNPLRGEVFLARASKNGVSVYDGGDFRPIERVDNYLFVDENERHIQHLRSDSTGEIILPHSDTEYMIRNRSVAKYVLIEKREDEYYFYGGDKIENLKFDKHTFGALLDGERFPYMDFITGSNGIMFLGKRENVFAPFKNEWTIHINKYSDNIKPYRFVSERGIFRFERMMEEALPIEEVHVNKQFKIADREIKEDTVDWINLDFGNGKRYTLYYGERSRGKDERILHIDISLLKTVNGYMVFSREEGTDYEGNKYFILRLIELGDKEFIHVDKHSVDTFKIKFEVERPNVPEDFDFVGTFLYGIRSNFGVIGENHHDRKTLTLIPNPLSKTIEKYIFSMSDINALLENSRTGRSEIKIIAPEAPLWTGIMVKANDPLYLIGCLYSEENELFYPVIYSNTTGSVTLEIPIDEEDPFEKDSLISGAGKNSYKVGDFLYYAVLKNGDYMEYIKHVASLKIEELSLEYSPAARNLL